MTSYLNRCNSSVRYHRAKDRLFEIFISHIEILSSFAVCCIVGICVLLFLITLADVASEPVAHSAFLASEQAPIPSSSPILQGHAPSAQANRPGRDLFAWVEQ